MATTRAALTDSDIRMLVKGATPDERALAAHKLCRNIDRATLDEEGRQVAHDILRVMAADAAELVRRALAVTLKNSPVLPPDVANRLARDVDSVSLPIINFSPVFTDTDLAEIVRVGGPKRQMAVAKRSKLSTRITTLLVDQGDETVVAAACANDNARFSEVALQKALDRFAKSEQVLQAVAYRSVLPLAVTERLIDMVGDQLRDHILSHHALSAELTLELMIGAKERATIDLVDQAGRAADPKAFVAHLHRVGRLSPSLILRGLAHGHMAFFEWAVAELAGIPHHRTWLMIHDAGPLGLKAICERAGLPPRLLPAFRAGVDAFHGLEFDGRAHDRERFQERMIQRFLTSSHAVSREDSEYLIERMDQSVEKRQAASA
ncbi:pole-localized protein SpbR [Caulobacter sp. RHG1]|uniref:pole-localized protein SpbR n=1 Tax=Caulobacter sp. (strain RHG1) TaxID=2545762 RepID=UPI0015579A97|nr:pole-localized protein SpbR [Caulobacter sp. RHG1]NQE62763.1 ATP-dependent protease HslVU (ClpYQ), ATPase subunit [Caulobacter sp. RHG1]